jgi:Ni/Co efflux regulator RcnB
MLRPSSVLALVISAALAGGSAWADDEHHGKPGKHGRDDRTRARVEVRFDGPQHTAVQGWYAHEIEAGHCPPGLRKTHNGCLPPGQAKKRWAVGRCLPREVIFHDLPPALVIELGPPPAGYRYARIANDVLLIAIGTGMVVDAITDLGRM